MFLKLLDKKIESIIDDMSPGEVFFVNAACIAILGQALTFAAILLWMEAAILWYEINEALRQISLKASRDREFTT